MAKTISKQAVVIIHGIGEQRPILTLRGFVEPIARYLRETLGQARQDEDLFWEKPDPISGNYETRKMVMRKGDEHPSTHFYEFYWAHNMRDTKFSHLKTWLNRVIFRAPSRVSRRLLGIFWLVWVLILLAVAALGIAIAHYGFSTTIARVTVLATGGVGFIVVGFVSSLLFNYLGDAARYLDPAPGNIAERQKIRAEGMALLKGLHKTGKYDRIIIVSHSLGTAIAYDLVKLLWSEFYFENSVDTFKKMDAAVLKRYNDQLDDVVEAAKDLGQHNDPQKQVAFRRGQENSFDYLKAIGNPWLITDLVTIGSPLAHAGHLFAQEKGLFDKLKRQREYPACPPVFTAPDESWILTNEKAVHASKISLRYFNHSSPFAVTKWTNIYYNTDYIGGPIAPLFGPGVKDIPKERSKTFFFIPGGHTAYWNFNESNHILKNIWEVIKS